MATLGLPRTIPRQHSRVDLWWASVDRRSKLVPGVPCKRDTPRLPFFLPSLFLVSSFLFVVYCLLFVVVFSICRAWTSDRKTKENVYAATGQK